jgi:AraC family transcriptional regulator
VAGTATRLALHSAPSAPACPAALWTHDQNDVQEVWTEPDRAQHIVCLQLSNFAAEMFLDGRLHYAMQHRSGTASLVRAGQRPRAILKGRWQIMHLYLPSNLFRDLHDGTSITGRPEAVELIDPKCTHDPAIHRIAQEVLSEMREGQPLSRLRTDALGLDLAIQLLRRWSNLAGTRALTRDPARGGLAPWQLRRVTDHMQSHLDRDVTLAELSALVGLSPYHFCRAFAASTGLPPHRWLVERRDRAREGADGGRPAARADGGGARGGLRGPERPSAPPSAASPARRRAPGEGSASPEPFRNRRSCGRRARHRSTQRKVAAGP